MSVNWTDVNNASSFLAVPNAATNGSFWTGMLVMIMAVLFIALISFGPEVAVLVTLFVGMFLGVILLYMGLVSTTVVGIVTGLLLFMILYLMYSSRQQNM